MSDFTASDLSFSEDPKQYQAPSGRSLRLFLGFIFAFTAIGLWLAPGASAVEDVLLLKTGFTGVLTLSAIASLLPRT